MALHPGLESTLLDVAYRGSLEPQLLDVAVKLAGPAELPLATWAIESLVKCINHGIGGGAEFPPAAGKAKLEAGGEASLGPAYAFRLSVAGVSPRFLRVFVEHLACAGHPHKTESISIVGSLPTDGTAVSVRETQMAAWLNDADAYPAAFPNPGFPVAAKSIPRGMVMKATVAAGRLDAVAAELEETFSAWQTAVLTYPTLGKKGRGVSAPHATFARTRTELCAKLPLFDHTREAARAQLVNAIARFHVAVAPIAALEISTP